MCSSLHTGPVRQPGGDLFTGIFERTENAYLGSFSGTQRNLEVQSAGHPEIQQGKGLP
jgi:hypothetical protein